MSAGTGVADSQRRRSGNPRDGPDVEPGPFQQRALLDVQLDEGVIGAARDFDRIKRAGAARRRANLRQRAAGFVAQRVGGLRLKATRDQPAPQAADRQASRFLGREEDYFDRPARLKAGPFQGTNRLDRPDGRFGGRIAELPSECAMGHAG